MNLNRRDLIKAGLGCLGFSVIGPYESPSAIVEEEDGDDEESEESSESSSISSSC